MIVAILWLEMAKNLLVSEASYFKMSKLAVS